MQQSNRHKQLQNKDLEAEQRRDREEFEKFLLPSLPSPSIFPFPFPFRGYVDDNGLDVFQMIQRYAENS